MKIKMIQTVEDSHPFIAPDPETGVPGVGYDIRKLYEGGVYDENNGGPGWADRAANLIRLGYAAEVAE